MGAIRMMWAVVGLIMAASAAEASQAVDEGGLHSAGDAKRPLQVNDLFRTESIGDVAFSPDGESVVFTRERPFDWSGTIEVTSRVAARSEHRRDIWVASVPDGAARIVTNGASDGAGFWKPVWSPDGARLAMLSTRGGAERLWVWEKATGRLTRLSDRVITKFAWVGSARIAALVVPRQTSEPMPVFPGTDESDQMRALRAWHKTWTGLEPSVNVFESGVPMDDVRHRDRAVILLDVRTGASWTLTSVTRESGLDGMHVAPDGKHVAYLQRLEYPTTPYRPGGENLSPGAGAQWRLVVATVEGTATVDMRVISAPTSTFQWAPDGRSFALLTFQERSKPPVLFRGAVDPTGAPVPISGVVPQSFQWIDGLRMLVLGKPGQIQDDGSDARIDWWLVSPGRAPRKLSLDLPVVPSSLVPVDPQRRTFVGIADGHLWRLDTHSREWTELTGNSDLKIMSLAWHPADRPASGPGVVVEAGVGMAGTSQYYRVDVASGAFREIVGPTTQAVMQDYHAGTDAGVFLVDGPTGTSLGFAQGEQQRRLALSNEFARHIALGTWHRLDYRSLDGEDLMAWILLPPGHHPGKRYPVVAWVYPGNVYGEDPPSGYGGRSRQGARGGVNDYSELQLYAARGYAVLYPSMPMPPWIKKGGVAGDRYLELTKGVLPALDEAVKQGLADGDRLAVMGHSFGGYATYGLVSQTNRFKAAISRAGPANLFSMYGTFIPYHRYRAQWSIANNIWAMIEENQASTGNPPWKDPQRYLRNSPIFHVAQIQTPLLIVQGDLDPVAIEQGEEFFTALARENKRARFLYYAGEGHSFPAVASPANARDMVYQVLSWLDEHLDVARDAQGTLLWNGDRARSRNGAPPHRVEDFARFDRLILERSP